MSWLRSRRRKEAEASFQEQESPGSSPEGQEEAANQAGRGCQERNPSNRKFGKH